jgi:2-C-methyl-D-erythritol 4-phosphate cytidylyltransferase
MANRISAVIVAAGRGARFGGLEQLKGKLGGKSLLCHGLDLFEADADCTEIILVVSPAVRDWIAGDPLTFASAKLKLVDGGDSRAASMAAGVRSASGELVALHDGNRPNFSEDLLARLKATVRPERGAVPAVAMHDALAYLTTIGDTEPGNGDRPPAEGLFGGKKADHRIGHIMEHVDQEGLYVLQTPQLYYRASFLAALDKVGEDLNRFQDDSALYLAAGCEVAVVPGWLGNVKAVTSTELGLLTKLMGGPAKKKKDKYGGLGW